MAGFRPQPRDVKFLAELGAVTVMDGAQIQLRYFANDRSGMACRRRLRLYQEKKLIHTLAATATIGTKSATTNVYRLAPAGLAYLSALGQAPPRFLSGDPKADTIVSRASGGR